MGSLNGHCLNNYLREEICEMFRVDGATMFRGHVLYMGWARFCENLVRSIAELLLTYGEELQKSLLYVLT